MNRTLIAKAARYVVNRVLLDVRRPGISWTTYARAGGPRTRR